MNGDPRRLGGRAAFSLIELLVAIVVIAVVATLMVPAFSGFGQAQRLTTAALAVRGSLDQARAEAIAQGTVVQMRIVVDDATAPDAAYRAFSLWKLDRQSAAVEDAYVPLTKWEKLPEGIGFVHGTDPLATWRTDPRYGGREYDGISIFDETSLQNRIAAAPYLRREADSVQIEFMPDGTLNAPTIYDRAVYLMLAPISTGTDDNWRAVFVSTSTGALAVRGP